MVSYLTYWDDHSEFPFPITAGDLKMALHSPLTLPHPPPIKKIKGKKINID